MKKLVAIVALGAVLGGLAPLPAHAHAGDAVLALSAFALYTALVLPFVLVTAPFYAASPPVAYSPAVAYSEPTYASVPPTYSRPARISREVVYPHGRYVLYGDGVSRAYQWIWIPNPPPPGSAPGY